MIADASFDIQNAFICTYICVPFLDSLPNVCTRITNQTAFTTKKDYGRGEREAQWATAQRTLHGLQPRETSEVFNDKNNYRELSEIAEQAKKRAEVARLPSYFSSAFVIFFRFNLPVFYSSCSVARLRELHTLKGHVESVVKLKGLDIDTIQQHYTV